MGHPTIADIVHESGISRATVDRVLNNRPGVHPRTREAVERAVAKLTARREPQSDLPPIDFALRLGIGMITQIQRFSACLDERKHVIHDLHQMGDAEVLRRIRALCEDISRPLVVAIMETPQVVAELARARRRGKAVVTMVSDLASEARDAFVGIDNRAAGGTAAFLIGRALGDRPTTIGLVLGDHAYRCHQDREIGFRHGLRTHFPRIALAAEAISHDNAEVAHAAVLKLLADHPGIAALYNGGSGKSGVAAAIAEAGRTHDILTITHEINHVTVPLMMEGRIDYLLSQDPRDLLREAVRQVDTLRSERLESEIFVDFGVYTMSNIPSYGRGAVV